MIRRFNFLHKFLKAVKEEKYLSLQKTNAKPYGA
jgi:hypothetical protein